MFTSWASLTDAIVNYFPDAYPILTRHRNRRRSSAYVPLANSAAHTPGSESALLSRSGRIYKDDDSDDHDRDGHYFAMRGNELDQSLDAQSRTTSRYDQKCAIVTRELESYGMGRYQWHLWTLCSFGYFLDLLLAHAFNLVLGPLEQEMGFAGDQSANIAVAFSSGLTIGALVWGVLVDIIGRKWAFNLTCLFSAVFCLCLGACNSYGTLLFVTACTGFGIGGNLPIDSTIVMEFIPEDRRFLLALLSIFQPIGVIVTSIMAYALIPTYSCSPNFTASKPLPSCHDVPDGTACCTRASNAGWRYLLTILGGITLCVFVLRFFIFNFQESPRFLVYSGRDRDAVRVLETIAKVNNTRCRVTIADFEAIDASVQADHEDSDGAFVSPRLDTRTITQKVVRGVSKYKLLFHTPTVARITILIWVTYAMDFSGFTLAGTYLPLILALKNGQRQKSLRYTYASYIAIYAPGIIGVIGGALMYRVASIGRKWTAVLAASLMSMAIFLFSTVNDDASNIGLNALEYLFQSMFNAILYGWTPELFPTQIRGTACGLASFWGRLCSILAPLMAQGLIPKTGLDAPSIKSILYLAGSVTLGCVVSLALLPSRIPGRRD